MQNTIINPSNRLIVLVYGILRMSRPAQLLAIILVYLFGSIVAWAQDASPNRIAFVYGLLVVLLVSASIHIANEYADYETDALTQRTLYSGGSGALQDLDLHPSTLKIHRYQRQLLHPPDPGHMISFQ